jgi:hypothetical protein
MNTRSFISPMSTRRSLPLAISFAASSRSVGISRSRAKWLRVPSGRIPSFVSVAASAAAHRALSAAEQLDLDLEPGRGQRIARALGELRVGGERAAGAVEEDGNASHADTLTRDQQ